MMKKNITNGELQMKRKCAVVFIFMLFGILLINNKEADAKKKTIKTKIDSITQIDWYDEEMGEAFGDLCVVNLKLVNKYKKNINGASGAIYIYEDGFFVRKIEDVKFSCIYSNGGKAYYQINLEGKKEDIEKQKYTFKYIYKESKKYKIISKNKVKSKKCLIVNNSYDAESKSKNNVYAYIQNKYKKDVYVEGFLFNNGELCSPRPERVKLKAKKKLRVWMTGSYGGDNPIEFSGKFKFVVTGVYTKK